MDEEEIANAKRAMAGPLGQQMAKFPLLFAKAAYFGQRPSRTRPTQIRSGTVTLADLGRGTVAITCQHVIEQYSKQRNELENVVFQIGHIELDPLAQLVDQNQRLDLAVLELTQDQVMAITSEGEIGSCVYRPVTWPVPSIAEGSFISFGGFPGALRNVVAFDEIEFLTWSSGATEVSAVSENRIVTAFDRSYWVSAFGAKENLDLRVLGGLSGGPAFADRGLYRDLVGIVSDYHENYDAMFFASTSAIRSDGTLVRPAV